MKLKSSSFLLVFLLTALGCGSDDSTPTVAKLTTIEVTSSNGKTIDVTGGSTKLTASGLDQGGSSYTFTEAVVWSVDNAHATIDSDGNVTPVSQGTSVVTASSEGIEGSITLTITDIFSQDYHFYISDAGNFAAGPHQILRVDQNGENPSVFTNENLAWPQDILFLDDGTVLVSNLSSGNITMYDQTTGNFIKNFAENIDGPTRMKIGPDGFLYVLQWQGGGKVRRYQLDGTYLGLFTQVGVNQSIGLDWDSDGNLYVSSFNGISIRKFDTSGNDLGIFIDTNSDPNLKGPTDIWFGDDGSLFVNDYSGVGVVKYDSNGAFVENFATGLNQAEGVAFLPNGNMLIGNGFNGAVKMFDTSGNFIEDFVQGGVGGLVRPNAIVRKDLNN